MVQHFAWSLTASSAAQHCANMTNNKAAEGIPAKIPRLHQKRPSMGGGLGNLLHLQLRPSILADFILATNAAMRCVACWILSIEVAYEQRIWPSPHSPNALPGTTATFSSKRSRSQNSSELKPVSFTEGNA